ncbi:hypothetical protein F5051DRAFT_431281 [Lentinula edodes]|nr:hypothetical protein F5051DRAFT_431281 [Lentinula edodes]
MSRKCVFTLYLEILNENLSLTSIWVLLLEVTFTTVPDNIGQHGASSEASDFFQKLKDFRAEHPNFILYGATTNQIVVEQLEQAKILLSDDKLLTIIDFSQAEREGWIEAFVNIWTSIPSDTRTPEQLRERAQELLKGCREHYCASVSRIKKIIGVVGNSGNHFENLALGLLDLSSSKEFQQHVGELRASFPLANDWIAWWIREEHASMLFKSQWCMELALWSSMPDNTSAEEAMHWHQYTAQGKNHMLFTDLQDLHTAIREYDMDNLNPINESKIRLAQHILDMCHRVSGLLTQYLEMMVARQIQLGHRTFAVTPAAPVPRSAAQFCAAPRNFMQLHVICKYAILSSAKPYCWECFPSWTVLSAAFKLLAENPGFTDGVQNPTT